MTQLPLTVEGIDNHVYFYSDVDSDRRLALIKQIKEKDGELIRERLSRSLPEDFPRVPIWLHISSYGGDLFSALALADQLKSFYSPIYSIVEGCVASAGTVLSMTCEKRFILPQSYMMIHQLSSVAWGTYEQMKDDQYLADLLMNNLIAFYAEHCDLTKSQVTKLLKRDSWFTAEEALGIGLVDEIL